MSKTYTFNLTPYGVKTEWGRLNNFNFNQANSSNWVGFEKGWPDTSVWQNYGVGLAGDIQVVGNVQDISLTVNYASQHNKGIAICKKTGAGTSNYGYQSLGVEKVATGGSTTFTINLTSKGVCPYGYFLYQPDYNTYTSNVYTINSAVLTIVTDAVQVPNIINGTLYTASRNHDYSWGTNWGNITGTVVDRFKGRVCRCNDFDQDYFFTSILFNQNDLTILQSKNIDSITLNLNFSTTKSNGDIEVRFKNNSTTTNFTSANQTQTGAGAYTITTLYGNASTVNVDITGAGLPNYGYVLGPASETNLSNWVQLSSVTLTVVTLEVEIPHVLNTTSVNGGIRLGWADDTWKDYKLNEEGSSNIRKAGGNGTYNYATNFLFNQSELAAFIGKTIISATLGITIKGTIQNTTNYEVAYKYNDQAGATTEGPAWVRTDASGLEPRAVEIAYIQSSSSQTLSSLTPWDVDVGTIIPKYGYVIGGYNGATASLEFGSTATLTVVTYGDSYTYILQYDANGGINAPEYQTGINTETTPSYTFTLSLDEPTRLGYEFLGWAESDSTVTPTYQPGDTFTVSTGGITTLYAVWKALNTIKIVNSNSGLDIYLVYVVENGSLVPYQVNIVDSNNNLIVCT